MSYFKVVLLFQDSTGAGAGGPTPAQHLGGWSESFISKASDITSLNLFLYEPGVWGAGLCPARASLLPFSASIVGQRISIILPKTGSSQTRGRTFPGLPLYKTDVPQMALQCTVPAVGAVNVRRFSIRCIPDFQVDYGEFSPDFPYDTFLKTYFNELKQWSFTGQDFTQTVYQVADIDANGLLSTVGNNTIQIGDTVAVQGFKIAFPPTIVSFKRTVTAVGPTANKFTLDNWVGAAGVGGTVRKVSYAVYDMDGANAVAARISVRKVGRPFGQYRGRRSKRKVI